MASRTLLISYSGQNDTTHPIRIPGTPEGQTNIIPIGCTLGQRMTTVMLKASLGKIHQIDPIHIRLFMQRTLQTYPVPFKLDCGDIPEGVLPDTGTYRVPDMGNILMDLKIVYSIKKCNNPTHCPL
jgi:hypothetical protein